MTVEEIKSAIASLLPAQQSEISVFLSHLRRVSDPQYQERVSNRLSDANPSHWLTPEDFEKQLDLKPGNEGRKN